MATAAQIEQARQKVIAATTDAERDQATKEYISVINNGNVPGAGPIASQLQGQPDAGLSHDTAGSPWPTDEAGSLTLQKGTETKVLKAGQHNEVDALTRSGWRPLNANGRPYVVVDWQGGQMFVDPDRPGTAVPLNVLLGGQPTSQQSAGLTQFLSSSEFQRAREQAQTELNQGGNRTATSTPTPGANRPTPTPPPSSPGNPLPSTGGTGNFTNNPNGVQIPNDWQDLLKFMTTAGLNRSLQSNGLIDLATGQLGKANERMSTSDEFVKSLTDATMNTMDQRNQLISRLLGDTGQPGILNTSSKLLGLLDEKPQFDPNIATLVGESADAARGFLDRQNDAPGFSPEGKAALNQQLTRDIPNQFNDALSSAYAELQRRGALGGELPGSQADLTRVLAPIYAAKSAAYSKANTDSLMSEEQLKLQQLLSNRGLASNAIGQLQGTGNLILGGNQQALQQLIANRQLVGNTVGQLSGLTSTLGQIFDPNAYAANAISGFNAGTGALGAANQSVANATGAYSAGNEPFNTAAGSANQLAETAPTSFKNLLLSSLFSSAIGGGAGGGNIVEILKQIPWDKIFGGGTPAAGGTDNPSGRAIDWNSIFNTAFSGSGPGTSFNGSLRI